ncbi:MAG: hypothetical protein K2H46_02585 [Muribaculaceae bacterium]|nr:hypothetical protein [Muribaculaceae bacterium]
MKKILRKIKEAYGKWPHKRRCRAIEKFRERMVEAYPDGEKFISRIKELDCKDTSIPVLALNAHFVGEGSISARGVCTNEVTLYEVFKILEDRRHHGLDVSGVRISTSNQNPDFVIELRFTDVPAFDKNSGE